jgi:hypothetical protein
MRKCKIESQRWVGCIKNLDIASSDDSFRAVGAVNMARPSLVLDLSARVVSISHSHLSLFRWWCSIH